MRGHSNVWGRHVWRECRLGNLSPVRDAPNALYWEVRDLLSCRFQFNSCMYQGGESGRAMKGEVWGCPMILVIITGKCMYHFILCTITALSSLAWARVSVRSVSSLFGNVVIRT